MSSANGMTASYHHAMRFRALTCALLSAALLSCRTADVPANVPAAVPEPGRTVDPASSLDAFFTALHQRGLFDGAVVVGYGNAIVWEKGYGLANVAGGVAYTPDTPTDGGSLAKTFTADLVLALAREGKLQLEEPAQRLLPELPYRNITLRHLLSHSSGLPPEYGYFDAFLPKDQVWTTEMLLGVLEKQKPQLAFVPGTAFEYNSLAYDLAALAAARAAGKSYGELLAERYFRPLGMTSAFLRPGRLDAFPGVRTIGYRRVAGELLVHDVFDFEAFHGGSNIYLSARDLYRWNASFLGRPQAELAQIYGHPSGLTLGSWYRSRDGDRYWYSGDLQGFHSEVFRDMRSQLSIVYVSNNMLAPWLQKSIVRAVTAILAGVPADVPAAPAVEEVSTAGTWVLPRTGTVVIDRADKRVFVTREGVCYPMFPVGGHTFYVPGLDWMVGFAKDGRIHVESNIDAEWGTQSE